MAGDEAMGANHKRRVGEGVGDTSERRAEGGSPQAS